MLAAVFAAATACIIVAARAGGRVGEAVASLVLLNAAFALPVFAMLVTAEVELPYISPTSPLYLPYISPTSPLYLPYIFLRRGRP